MTSFLLPHAVSHNLFSPSIHNHYARAGHIEEAFAAYDQAIALPAGDSSSLHKKARYWSNLGSLYIHEKRYEEAIQCYEKARGKIGKERREEGRDV